MERMQAKVKGDNIIYCPHCGRNMIVPEELTSEKYLLHPDCGRLFRNPLINTEKKEVSVDSSIDANADSSKIMRGLLVCVVAVISLAVFGTGEPSCSSSQDDTVRNSGLDASVWQVERYIKNHLNDPDSYKSMEWSKVQKKGDVGYYVRHKYRAKNMFGGYVIHDQIFHLDADGKVIGVDNFSDYQELIQ